MSDLKRHCPACGGSTTAIGEAFREGLPCPYCDAGAPEPRNSVAELRELRAQSEAVRATWRARELLTSEESVALVRRMLNGAIQPHVFQLADGSIVGRLCVDPDVAFTALRPSAEHPVASELEALVRWLATEVELTDGLDCWFAYAAQGADGDDPQALTGCPHPGLLREVLDQ